MDFSIKAKQLFIKHTKYSEHDIKNIENIVSSGYTNLNYKITAKDKKQFLVKLSRNKTWIFCDESIITSKYLKSNILYSDNSGNMIKKWVDGELFSLHDNLGNRINLLFREINKVNKINLKNQIPIFNWATYIDFLAKKRKYIDLYNKILLKYKDDNMVVTHGDLNNKNIIISKKNKKESITFIDFEWSCYNYWWFDPISYLCEEQIDDLSVTLDEWTEDQIDSMLQVGGNSYANTVYEAFLPKDYPKPTANSSNEERADFIR